MPAEDARVPRPLILLVVAAIVGAVVLSFVWPRLTLASPAEPSSAAAGTEVAVGIIRRQIDDPASAPRIGSPVPDFEWDMPDGRTLRLAELRGKTLIVDFWATWCVPCREEMPRLDAAARADPDLVVLAVDLQEDAAAVRGFFGELGLGAMRPILDPGGETFRRWGVYNLPTNFFVDPEGIIRHVVVGGPMSDDAIRAAVDKARAP